MAPSRRREAWTVESLKRTLCTNVREADHPLFVKSLPDATLSAELKLAQTNELGQAAQLLLQSECVELRGTVLCITSQGGAKRASSPRCLQITYCNKLPPPPMTGFNAEAIAQAEGALKHDLTLVLYTKGGCFWLEFESAKHLIEWETVSRTPWGFPACGWGDLPLATRLCEPTHPQRRQTIPYGWMTCYCTQDARLC